MTRESEPNQNSQPVRVHINGVDMGNFVVQNNTTTDDRAAAIIFSFQRMAIEFAEHNSLLRNSLRHVGITAERAAANLSQIGSTLEHATPQLTWAEPTFAPDEHEPSGDAMRLNLEATQTCWKKVGKIETCGEPADPRSETGCCTNHYEEYRD